MVIAIAVLFRAGIGLVKKAPNEESAALDSVPMVHTAALPSASATTPKKPTLSDPDPPTINGAAENTGAGAGAAPASTHKDGAPTPAPARRKPRSHGRR